MNPTFSRDQLVVFVGHSDDARAEADVVRDMESAFQAELHRLAEVMDQPPFHSVKVWEWSMDAKGGAGSGASRLELSGHESSVRA